MTFLRLLTRNLLFHWRGNAPVLLGVLVGSTVLTGALLVGDALKGSLLAQAERRLGWVDHAVVAPRYFRAALAGEVAETADARVSPALLLQATAVSGDKASRRQLRGVTVIGADGVFFPATGPGLWVNRAVAEALNVRAGDTVTLRLQKPADVHREAALGKKDVTFLDWELPVAAVLGDDEPGAVFNLRPDLSTPRNVIVALPRLQQHLGLEGQANVLLAAGDGAALAAALRERLTLEDWGLALRTPLSRARDLVARHDTTRDGQLQTFEWRHGREKGRWLPKYAWVIEEGLRPTAPPLRTVDDFHDYFARLHPVLSLESRQLLLADWQVAAAAAAAMEVGLSAEPALVYLCRMRAGNRRTAGVVAALGPANLPDGKADLGDGDILLSASAWQALSDPATPAKSVELIYKPPESHGPAPDRTATFRVAGHLSSGGPPIDAGLTPEFPGITDKEDVGAWDLPFEDPDWQKNISSEYGDPYWKRFRTAPKAFITLRRGQQLWGSRLGDATSVRLAVGAAPSAEALEQAGDRFRAVLLRTLDPERGGLTFEPTRATALAASQGGTPFDLLFLAFSFFLILSALLLVGLLYRLNLDRRAREAGLLFAEGFPRRTVRTLYLGEGGALALAGAALGCLVALFYSRWLIALLAALWPGGALQSLLRPHPTPASLVIGAAATLAVSLLTIAWVVRVLGRVPPRALLAGQTTQEGQAGGPRPATWLLPAAAAAAALLGAGLLAAGPWVPGHEARAGTFFGSGALFLTAGLVGLYAWMKRGRAAVVEGRGWWTVGRLGVRNAARHPLRSLLTVGLLASAAFVLVAVESFRRRVPTSDGTPFAADGGFALVGESDLPVIRDPGTPAGRKELLAGLRAWLTAQEVGQAEVAQRLREADGLLDETTIVPLRARAGDDASCLNLYKPRSPRVLGVPRGLIERGGFVFAGTLARTPEEKANPWRVLLREDGPTPAFGEANTVVWMLRSGLGKTVDGPPPLQVAGLLHDSVFASSLLVSEGRFLQLYPEHEGYNYFLIAPPTDRAEEVRLLLERALSDRGLEVTSTQQRVAAYLAVENTYLTTFQALGGLGLVLGSLGLAVVLLRAVWERRAELALLRALGYPRWALAWLVLAENGYLLLAGLVIGAAAALLSVVPQLVSGEGAVPWGNLALLFAGVLLVALSAGAVAVLGTLRAPIVPALRRE